MGLELGWEPEELSTARCPQESLLPSTRAPWQSRGTGGQEGADLGSSGWGGGVRKEGWARLGQGVESAKAFRVGA